MTRSPRLAGLTTRLLAVCLGLYVVTATATTLVEVIQVSEQASQSAKAEIASLARTFAPPLESALWSYDFGQVEILLRVLGEIQSVGRVRLTTTENKVYQGTPEEKQGPFGAPLVVPLAHDRGKSSVFVGTLRIESSLSAVNEQTTGTISRAVTRTLLVVVLLSAVLFFTAGRVVGRPLRTLAEQISRIDPQAPSLETLKPDRGAGAEMTLVADAFNRVLDELFSLKSSLESMVASRTAHLELTIQELSSTRDKLVDAAKMAVLGQLVAGVAHDLNTPLGAALSASSSAMDMLGDLRSELTGPAEQALLSRIGDTVGRQDSRLRRQLVREAEAAGLANDDGDKLVEMGVEPPLGELGPLLTTTEGKKALARVHQHAQLVRTIRVVALASEKMASVVENLLRYSRKEAEATPLPSDLSAQLETILVLFAAAVKSGVNVVRKFEPVPEVICRADRLQQVWINLVGNAVQAMEGKGTLELGIKSLGDTVEVSVANDGPPIPAEVAKQLFTPFFTTKPRGSGTGLGLSICQRIVEEHGGAISFSSGPGRTVFTVRLPVRPVSSPSVS